MSAHAAPRFISVEEYLAGEETSDVKHEYVGGTVYAMAGTTRAHNTTARNLLVPLAAHLRGGPCEAYMSDVKVRLLIRGLDIFYYPDVMVGCDPRDTHEHYLRFPKLIVEVASRSTERRDRSEKLLSYITIPTLEEYVIILRRQPSVIVYRRRTEWQPEAIIGLDSALHLESVDMAVPLNVIYENVRDLA